MLEQAIDFKDESNSLYEILANCSEDKFSKKTQFKSWTINDVIYHLHVWNIAASLSLKNEKKFNMSGGKQLRDYLHVEKVAKFIVKISLQNKINGIINCCSGKPISIRDLVEGYLEENNKNIELNLGHFPYPDYEPMAFWGDNKKLNKINGITE